MREFERRDNPREHTGATPAARRSLEVTVDERGVESALRAFKRLVLRDGILREAKRKRSYEKPGERKRRKVREAARRRRRQATRALRRKDDRP
ncbi:MAG: 30S ribosomal protein S21 [candidate division NC10 bacterium]|jgi:small subunit ribosomal protein S21|nr:30S ribosomal protein S21 [candidate division NC10 bacterium]MCH7897297.1 30S ribosomal protein S21 [candidate division NC10 bacterium]MCZ6552141.1 30S ribosomal protein S21 [candidate division NC10 bacterium]